MEQQHIEFKRMFWKWFDALPEQAKRSYQYSKIHVAEEYYREFFYQTDKYKWWAYYDS